MRISKQARRLAKELFTLCRVDGRLDEDRVRAVLRRLVAARPRGYVGIARHFQRLVELDLARRRALVESAAPLSPELRSALEQALERRHGPGLRFLFAENPALLGGLRVRVGSDVYDGSIAGRLAALAARF
jgi:F-type H+-transporting ATPase subunit delta